MNQITVTVAPPMSQSTALVLSLSRAGAARSARSYLLLHSPISFSLYSPRPLPLLSFLPDALFIVIIPQRALASLTHRALATRLALRIFLAEIDEKRTNLDGKENVRGYEHRAKGNFILDQILFPSVPFFNEIISCFVK